MKKLLLIPFVLIALLANAQTDRKSHHTDKPPLYFLDSVQVEKGLPMFDLDKIESLSVVKDTVADESGKPKSRIYINMKKGTNLTFLTLEQIAKKFTKAKGPYLYIINDIIIKDIQDTRIDSSYILRCEVTTTKEIVYLKDVRPMTILNIKTRNKANLEKEKEKEEEKKKIWIRGLAATIPEEKSH